MGPTAWIGGYPLKWKILISLEVTVKALIRSAKITAVLMVLSSLPAGAQETNEKLAALEKRVARLETAYDELIAALKGAMESQVAPAQPSKHQNIDNWRTLQKGMKKAEVKAILGEPMRIFVGFRERWLFSDGGDVTFDGRSRLDGWSEP